LDNGDVLIYDLTTLMFSKFKVELKLQFPDKPSSPVTDIKCHPLKMHRLLIAYKDLAVGVFSINKNRMI
jgi:hypothetical protein